MSDASSDENFAGLDQNDVDLASCRFAGTFYQINEPPSNVSVPEYSSSEGQVARSAVETGLRWQSDIAGNAPTPIPKHSINYC